MSDEAKKVFISYSWAVQARVIELAERLFANGITVVIDVYDLKEGQDKYAFMEQSVSDPSIDRVLIICDKTYTEKANNRSGGVGDETVIISPEIYGKMQQEKFIPIIFESDVDGNAYCPIFIKSRIYIDLSVDNNYEAEYEKLLRNIFEKPLFRRPALGKKPAWLEDDAVDLSAIRDLIKQVRGYSGSNDQKANFLLRKGADEFVAAAKQYTLPEGKPVDEGILQVIDELKVYKDLFVDYCDALLYSNLPFNTTITSLLEQLYNELHDTSERRSYRLSEFEAYDFLLWELFISITALCLHYEAYSELYEILTHTYFLTNRLYTTQSEAHNYTEFWTYLETIEDVCKPKAKISDQSTLRGEILVSREKKPILTKGSISNADLVLYQLYPFLDLNQSSWKDYWYPTTYVYQNRPQRIWQKLRSRQYCERIMPLFGVNSLEDLKEKLSRPIPYKDMGYTETYKIAPPILASIKLDEIGTMK